MLQGLTYSILVKRRNVVKMN